MYDQAEISTFEGFRKIFKRDENMDTYQQIILFIYNIKTTNQYINRFINNIRKAFPEHCNIEQEVNNEINTLQSQIKDLQEAENVLTSIRSLNKILEL